MCTVVPFLSQWTPARHVLRPHVWGLLAGVSGSAELPQPFGCIAAVVAPLTALDVLGLLDGR